MKCDNCGAPMTLVEARDYFYCEYCAGSYHFLSELPDGIRALDEMVDGISCPICHIPLSRATIYKQPGLHCTKCKGLLLDQIIFGDIMKYQRAYAQGPPIQPELLDRAELVRQIGCPHCNVTMESHPYGGPGNIAVDSCRHCRVIWLVQLGTNHQQIYFREAGIIERKSTRILDPQLL